MSSFSKSVQTRQGGAFRRKIKHLRNVSSNSTYSNFKHITKKTSGYIARMFSLHKTSYNRVGLLKVLCFFSNYIDFLFFFLFFFGCRLTLTNFLTKPPRAPFSHWMIQVHESTCTVHACVPVEWAHLCGGLAPKCISNLINNCFT